jgi:ASC-1-like (ASCH) protein
MPQTGDKKSDISEDAERSNVPLGRVGKMDELGNLATFLMADGCEYLTGQTIAIDGFAADTANRLRAGDFIKFNGHTKVYMVVADVTSSSNAATVTIEPPLREALADDSSVTYDNIPFTVYLVNEMQEFGAIGADKDGNVLYKFELDVEESL